MSNQDRSEATSQPTSDSGAKLEDRTRTELFELAHRLEIVGYAEMSRQELIEAIRRR